MNSIDTRSLLDDGSRESPIVASLLIDIGFRDPAAAAARLAGVCRTEQERELLADSLPSLLHALTESASPDASLVNFERYLQAVPDRHTMFKFLRQHPRAVEILVRLFVGSQYLTEILIRRPGDLERLTQHRLLADIKHREEFRQQALHAAEQTQALDQQFDAVRRFQKWELLRLGSCDQFGLMDLKTVTLQMALLADGITQCCLDLLAAELSIDVSGFAVLAFGKLGGEELNYSSDIDLVFVADREAEQYWPLGQKLIGALMKPTADGFLYRVDMRLRPWGGSGPLVCTADAYLDYLQTHGRLWEKQALLKARCIAGNRQVGEELIEQLQPILTNVEPAEVRANIRKMKQSIEVDLARSGRGWGEVKVGQGGIRDVEFIVQGLQLIHGGRHPSIRSTNTLDGIVRLADGGLISAEEYRRLRSGYAFLRNVEHALQLMHNKQLHTLPREQRELEYLARRLDFPGVDEFVEHFDQHCREIRNVFDSHFGIEEDRPEPGWAEPNLLREHMGTAADPYEQCFDEQQRRLHLQLLNELDDETLARIAVRPVNDGCWELTVVGIDQIGDLSAICGLLFVFGFNIDSGNAFTAADDQLDLRRQQTQPTSTIRKFVDVFTIRPAGEPPPETVWHRYETDLLALMQLLREGKQQEVHGRLAKRVARLVRDGHGADGSLLPVEIGVDNATSQRETILEISTTDSVGFLYELTNALSLSGVSILRMQIRSLGGRVIDTLQVTDREGKKIVDEQRIIELRAAIVLIKHFTHLLPSSPNPESALLNFRELLAQLFSKPDWLNELAQLQNSSALKALAQLLGVSDFLWHDFLKLQHANLFPVVTNIEALQRLRSRDDMRQELSSELQRCETWSERRAVLNQFKDREMLRVDMRHILSLQHAFGLFGQELTDVAEVVVQSALDIATAELSTIHGTPRTPAGEPSRLVVCALGKCGGRELGFASDIELMFIVDGEGVTDGEQPVSSFEFYESLVDRFRSLIDARRKGIFEIDLRLRPYGNAGSHAVPLSAFADYFRLEGAAWPYERQALVKLRPIAGDLTFGREVVTVRDQILYTGAPFDVAAMRAMREKQLHQLVAAGTFNAKLSPGALVDVEYLVQGLQITHGAAHPELRVSNTREALKALEAVGLISRDDRLMLRDAYRFFRRVIDGLRMVRGDARDLTVPPINSEEHEFLARRLGYRDDVQQFQRDLDTQSDRVRNLGRLMEPGASN